MPHLLFRRYHRLLLLLALLIAGLIIGLGDQPIRAYSLQDSQQVAETVMSYGHSLAALVGLVPDGILVPGSAQAPSAADSE